MKAHSLMQAIARANRVYPGKDCGVIVDRSSGTSSRARENISKADRERLKQASRSLLASLRKVLASMRDWT